MSICSLQFFLNNCNSDSIPGSRSRVRVSLAGPGMVDQWQPGPGSPGEIGNQRGGVG